MTIKIIKTGLTGLMAYRAEAWDGEDLKICKHWDSPEIAERELIAALEAKEEILKEYTL